MLCSRFERAVVWAIFATRLADGLGFDSHSGARASLTLDVGHIGPCGFRA